MYKITPQNLDNISEKQENSGNITVEIKINKKGQGVEGSGLWKMGVWASANDDGSGDRIGYEEQV